MPRLGAGLADLGDPPASSSVPCWGTQPHATGQFCSHPRRDPFSSQEIARTDLFLTGMFNFGPMWLKFAQGVKALSSALCISHHSPMYVRLPSISFISSFPKKRVFQVYSFSPVSSVTWEATPCLGRPQGVIYAHFCTLSTELRWACNLALLSFVVSQPISFFLISVCKRPL